MKFGNLEEWEDFGWTLYSACIVSATFNLAFAAGVAYLGKSSLLGGSPLRSELAQPLDGLEGQEEVDSVSLNF